VDFDLKEFRAAINKDVWGRTVNIKSITKSWRTIHLSQSEGPSLELFQNNNQQ